MEPNGAKCNDVAGKPTKRTTKLILRRIRNLLTILLPLQHGVVAGFNIFSLETRYLFYRRYECCSEVHYMSENSSRLTTLLNQLTSLSIEEQDRLGEVHRRHQHNVRLHEATFREHKAELEQQHQEEIEHDNTVLEASRARISSEFQERRRSLIVEIRTEEHRTDVAAATVVASEETGDGESSRDASGFLDADDVIRHEDGKIEIVYSIPHLPFNAGTTPAVLPIGSPIWVLNPLKLAQIQKRSHLKGVVLSRGKSNGKRTVYTIQVYNPFTKEQEEHRRQRQNLAIRHDSHEFVSTSTRPN